jgi:GNAT superfamily N-acetyltransferase
VSAPISIRLDDDVRMTLEEEARAKGVGLATYLRDLAAQAARDVRRARIRDQSAQVARRVAEDPDALSFYEDWGSPPPETT